MLLVLLLASGESTVHSEMIWLVVTVTVLVIGPLQALSSVLDNLFHQWVCLISHRAAC